MKLGENIVNLLQYMPAKFGIPYLAYRVLKLLQKHFGSLNYGPPCITKIVKQNHSTVAIVKQNHLMTNILK